MKRSTTFYIYLVLSILCFISYCIFKQLRSDIHKYNGIYSLDVFPNILPAKQF